MRLIDANKLRKDIVERGAQLSGCYSAGIARYMDRMLAHVLAEVDIAPAVDAVPVVRCKDCRHAVDYYHEGDCYCSNPKWGLNYFGGSWEFYCADAERRNNE